jgi:hypothetical protein
MHEIADSAASVALAVFSNTKCAPWPAHIMGVITKEHAADSIAKTVQIYPG